jgi:hypothetical protein
MSETGKRVELGEIIKEFNPLKGKFAPQQT